MAGAGQDGDSEAVWKRPFGALLRWAENQSDNLLLMVLGWLLFGSGGALVIGTISGIDLGVEFPAWVLIAAFALGLIGLGIGSLVGFCLASKALLSRGRGWGAVSAAEALHMYTELARLTTFTGSFDPEWILPRAAGLAEKGVGEEVHISMLRPELAGRSSRWDLPHHPTHSSMEADDFKVSVDGSWIAHNQTLRGPGTVFGHRDISATAVESDLKAFFKHGYRSMLCCRVPAEIDGVKPFRRVGPCLVMLSRTPKAFSALEESYLEDLALAFGLRLRERRLAELLGEDNVG